MGLIHTPRVIASIAKGLYKRKLLQYPSVNSSLKTPHVYEARAGLLDVDYMGHLNNAAYLNHAELARWEMTATSGMLGIMARHNIHYVVASLAIRYRREIRPVFRKFQIESSIVALDERNITINQVFRHMNDAKDTKLKGQLLLQGVAIRHKKILDPRQLFKVELGVDPDIVDQLCERGHNHIVSTEAQSLDSMIDSYEKLESAFKANAALDDSKVQ